MPLVLAFDDLKPEQVKRNIANQSADDGPDKPSSTVFRFCWATRDTPVAPGASLIRYDKGTRSSAHFHSTDQFNIVVEGKGLFGRHELGPYHVHFSRAYTPYGPLLPDKDAGWAFLTLRTRYEPGAQRLPAAQDKLKQIPGRRPWQITRKVEFPVAGPDASLKQVPDITDEHGLFTCALAVAPHACATAPSPAGGDGQYVIVLKGSLLHEGREHKALTLVFIKPGEEAYQIHAGAQGLEGLIVNFPQVTASASVDAAQPGAVGGSRKWQCVLCAYAYDEARGMPDDGIPAGTPWQDVPQDWTCPDCGAGKADFDRIA